MQMLRWYSE